jgi:hypothetical protein
MGSKILSLYVTQVRCVDETEHEGVWPFQGEGVANDAIRLSVTITAKGGSGPVVQRETSTFNLGDNYQDGTVVNVNQQLFSTYLSSDSDYPFAVNAILVLGEEDWGGNFDNQVKNIINQIGNEARNAVSAAVASAVGGAIGSAFGPIGSLIGAGAGAAAGLLVNLAITGVQSLESDVWPPNDISFIIDRSAQSIIHTLPPIVFGRRAGFRDLGGTYELTCEWRVRAAELPSDVIALSAAHAGF